MGNYDGMWPPPALVPEAYTYDNDGQIVGTAADDESVCADGYPEHVEVVDYQGDDGTQWHCSRCGAEGWEDAEEEG